MRWTLPNSSIRCVIFDCDGTLVDSERLCQQAMVEVFARFGGELDVEECMAQFQGGKLTDILAANRKKCGISTSIDILEPLYRSICNTLFEEHLIPIAGVPEMLAALHEHNIDVCVASNGPVFKMEHTLGLTQLDHYFEGAMFSAFDIQCWKPAPDLLHYAAMQMGYRIEECLFVDDTEPGIEAGINANMRTLYYRPEAQECAPLHSNVKTIRDMRAVLAEVGLH
uniref:HAD-IA family hydrolase n=1 Tax=Thaumasiovibrio occultus TaxID=1891184 RepID=UPI000B34D8C5|nr:HAD-IA family hydrolase [Thaumasiovibrio occultus]